MTVDTRSSRCSTGTACSSSFACRECQENVKRTDCIRRNRFEHARHCTPELRRADRILQGNRYVRAVRTTHCWNRRPFPLALRTLKRTGGIGVKLQTTDLLHTKGRFVHIPSRYHGLKNADETAYTRTHTAPQPTPLLSVPFGMDYLPAPIQFWREVRRHLIKLPSACMACMCLSAPKGPDRRFTVRARENKRRAS